MDCGIRHDGSIACWNSPGWTFEEIDPEFGPAGGGFVDLVSRAYRVTGLTKDGEAVSVGYQPIAPLAPGPGPHANLVGVGCSLRVDGRVECWNSVGDPPELVPGQASAACVTDAGLCVARPLGGIDCYELLEAGADGYSIGERINMSTWPLGYGPQENGPFTNPVACGNRYQCFSRLDGTPYCWSAYSGLFDPDEGPADLIPEWWPEYLPPPDIPMSQLASAWDFAAGLDEFGDIHFWGEPWYWSTYP